MPANEILYCEHCGKKLNPERTVWLELNCLTLKYTDPNISPLPDDVSQGIFPIGTSCAKKLLKDDK